MAKQLNVSMKFTADTAQAKTQLKELSNSLNTLTSGTYTPGKNFVLTDKIKQATIAATDLKVALDSAMDIDTGNLDLKKFNESLKKGGTSLSDYAKHLNNLGPEGQKAFSLLSKSIVQAEIPLRKTNKVLDEFKTSLMNTARWQLSSSILHGFMGALQTAYGYAQDLNASLNDIRIVTGYSSDEMARFAVEANNAAKALSTTTTDYTKASLIYYQQGLSNSEVKERTDVTIKMANVARQSAEVVSDQMTAVWNNFDDGSKSLEYYADVMTALGAATASSTDEIAQGLEKFAAVSETVGLSYEYATAALATVTAETRQSADVVGTAFKTLFARIQGLELGETLEDGTTLNDYSEALAKVGVNIKQANGDLKDMDQILTEMAGVWDTLGKAEQVALAEKVAGVRQYNQLMSLMNNWDVMEENLNTARNAEGALNEQANIYAESWEAAEKRVKASFEDIYDSVINDKAIIGLTNVFADLVDLIGTVVDGLGGMRGVILLAGNALLKSFGPELTKSLDNFIQKTTMTTEKLQELKRQDVAELTNTIDDSIPTGAVLKSNLEVQMSMSDQLVLKQMELEKQGKSLTDVEKRKAELLMDQAAALGEQKLKYAQLIEESSKYLKLNNWKVTKTEPNISNEQLNRSKLISLTTGVGNRLAASASQQIRQGDTKEERQQAAGVAVKEASIATDMVKKQGEAWGMMKDEIEECTKRLNNFIDRLKQIENDGEVDLYIDFENKEAVKKEIEQIDETVVTVDVNADLSELAERDIPKVTAQQLNEADKKIDSLAEGIVGQVGMEDAIPGKREEFNEFLDGVGKDALKTSERITTMAQAFSSLAMTVSTFSALGDTWKSFSDGAISGSEAIIQTITQLTMILPSAISGIKDLTKAWKGASAAFKKGTIAIALITTAISALIIVYDKLKDIYNADAIAAEKAAEKTRELAEATQEAKAQLNNIVSDVSGYEDLIEKLEDCTKGTDEWAESLKNVNEKTSELLEKYPELLKYENLFNEDGTINVDVLKDFQDQKEINAQLMSYALTQLQIDKQKAEYEARKTDFVREERTFSSLSQAGLVKLSEEGQDSGMVSNDDSWSYISGILEILGKGQEKTTELDVDNEKNLEAILNSYSLFGETALDEDFMLKTLGMEDFINGELDNAVAQYLESLRTLARENNSFDIMERNSYKSAVLDWSRTEAGQTALKGKDLSEVELAILGNKLKDEEDRLKNELNNIEDKDLFEQWNKLQGTSYKLSSEGIKGEGSEKEFNYIDENGDPKKINIETMKTVIATQQALATFSSSVLETANFLDGLKNRYKDDKDYGDDLINFISSGGKFTGMSEENVEKILEGVQINSEGKADQEALFKNLTEAFGLTSIDELVDLLGLEDSTQLYNRLNSEINNTILALSDVSSELTNTTKQSYDNLDLKSYNIKQKEIVADTLEDALINGGVEGVKAVEEVFSSLGDQGGEFAEILQDIDWQTADVETVKSAMEDAGIEMDKLGTDFDQKLPGLIEGLKSAEVASTETLGSLSEDYVELDNILKEVQETGDTISKESYEKLDPEIAEEYFTKMIDGTYMLTKDAEDFYKAVSNTKFKGFEDAIEALNKKLENTEKLIKALENPDEFKKTANTAEKANYQIDYLQQSEILKDTEAEEYRIRLENATGNAAELSKIYEELANKLSTATISAENLTEEYNAQLENVQEILEAYQLEYFLEQLPKGLSAEETAIAVEQFKTHMESVNANIDASNVNLDEVKAGIEDFAGTIYSVNASLESANDLLEGIRSGTITEDNIKDNESFQALNDQINNLIEQYPELNYYAEVLNNTWLVGTEEYYNALDELQNKLYEIQMSQLAEEQSENIAEVIESLDELEIGVTANTEEFEKAMDEIIDKEYEINVLIHGEAEQEFDSLIDGAKELETYAAKIGEDYIVAADDIRELNQVFPGIIENMKTLEDGTVQLSKTAVHSAMYAAEQEVKADAQATVEKINNQIAVLESKKASYQNIADAARTLASIERGEIKNTTIAEHKAADAKRIISDSLEEIEKENSQSTTNSKIQNAVETADSSNLNAEQVAKNWQQAYQSAADSSYQFATTAIQNMKAVESGGTIVPVKASIGVNYSGGGGIDTEASIEESVRKAIENPETSADEYDRIAQEYDLLVDKTNSQINDLKGMQAQIGATSIEVDKTFGNVDRGEGPKGKDDDSEEKERGDIHYKDLNDEIERYHEINEELEDINRNLNRISKEKDKAFGQAKLDMIDAEIAATEELIDAQERYIKEAERNYYSDQAILRGFGAQFDEAGRISNYDYLMASEVARYNSMAARYDGIEGWESAMESANKRYEDFQEAISNYEESLNTLEKKEDELKDYVDQVAELKLAKIEYEVEVKVLLNDTELDYLEYLLDNLENQAFDGAKNAIILEQQAQIVKNSLEANQEGIEDIFKSKGASQAEILAAQKGNPSALAKYDFTEDEVNSILNMMESMLDYNKELMKINEEMKELVSKTWEESNKKIDKYLDRYEYFGALTESYLDIIDIVGQKALDIPDVFVQGIQKVQTQIGKANIESYVDDLKRLKSDLAAVQKQIAEAEKAGNQEYLEMWSKQEEDILKRYTETQQNLLSTISDSLQTVMDTYTEKLQTIFEYFEKEMVIGHDSLEKFAERFDRNTILNDQYLPEYKKIYELSKLTRKINDSIDNTSSLKAKKELRSLQQQINSLQKEGVEVSEYDLNFLQKKYDLELARLSLEESREAKSEVRLVRDAEGAYGYVYTANEDAISDAQQKYEDALYEAQSLNEGYISDLQADYIATQQEMMQTLSDMKLSDYGNSPEAYRAAFEETYSFYQKRLQYYSNELGKVLDNNSLLYTDDVLTYDSALKIKELRGESFTMHFKDTILGDMLGSYNTLADYTENLVQIIGSWDDPSTLLGELNNNWQDWHSAVDEILQATGTSVEDFGETVLYTLMGNDNPENVVAIMFGATDQSKVALEGFIDFLDNDTSEGLTRLQQTFIETMIEPNGTSAAESMRLLTEAAGYPNTESGYLNALCQVFGYTGDDAEKLKNRIRTAVGAGGSLTSSDTILGALSDMEIKGSRNFSNLEKNVYGSIYEGTSGHGGIIKAVEDTQKTVDKLERESANDFKEMIKKVDAWENDWVKEFKSAREYTNKLYVSYMKLVEAMSQARRYPDDTKRVVTTHVDVYEDQPYSYKNPDTATTIHNNTEDDYFEEDEETYGLFATSGVADNYKNWFTSTTNDPWVLTGFDNVHKSGTKNKYTFEKNGVERSIYLDNDQYEKLLKQGYFIEPFDTGGYTGDWGTSDGRLALLHEKELILNKSDTKNMLSAISVLRDLVSKIELNSLMAMTTNIQSPFALTSEKTSDTIQQNVTIQADFPNVQDHNEIEQALNSLTLKASQYVNRK